MQFRKMALGLPLLSIIRNAVEWLADSNDSVTLLLSFVANVLNGDTECYLVHSVLILPAVPYCNWMPSAFDMVT